MRPIIERLLPGASIVTRPRLSQLEFAGDRKITRQPRRTAIVAFSADEVYAIAELIRRQHGGAAVVLGSLSPRTRNAQVEMFQNGDVDYLVATDAVGMGLNLDVDHVAFASDRKYDGYQFRRLNPSEFAQIAGRAGRATRNGTFGTTGRCAPFEPELVNALQNHTFDSVKMLQWRNSKLGLLLARLAAGLAGALARARGSDPRADRRGSARARSCGARRRGEGHGPRRGRRGAAVGRLPDPGLPAAGARRPCRTRDHALRVPDEKGPDSRRLVRRPGRPGRPRYRRYRHAVGPDRANPHLDLRRQPAGLAFRPRSLAGDHAGGRK